LLRESIRVCKQKRPFDVNAWVALPEHMHSTAWMQEVEQRRSSCRASGLYLKVMMIFLTGGRLLKLIFLKDYQKMKGVQKSG
jgi:hypothetical protein